MSRTFNLPDGISPTILYITAFHDHVLIVLALITLLICAIVSSIRPVGKYPRHALKGNESLELVWTLMPCITLMGMAAPSLVTLYMNEEARDPRLTVKVNGHQWYWRYEYDLTGLRFDSYIVPRAEAGRFRLLDVDAPLVLPLGHNIRAIVTSRDVIHSWAVPSLGVKVDAVPGRLNQLRFRRLKVGKVYGQCSEICGTGHSFMPIGIRFVPESVFISWLKVKLD